MVLPPRCRSAWLVTGSRLLPAVTLPWFCPYGSYTLAVARHRTHIPRLVFLPPRFACLLLPSPYACRSTAPPPHCLPGIHRLPAAPSGSAMVRLFTVNTCFIPHATHRTALPASSALPCLSLPRFCLPYLVLGSACLPFTAALLLDYLLLPHAAIRLVHTCYTALPALLLRHTSSGLFYLFFGYCGSSLLRLRLRFAWLRTCRAPRTRVRLVLRAAAAHRGLPTRLTAATPAYWLLVTTAPLRAHSAFRSPTAVLRCWFAAYTVPALFLFWFWFYHGSGWFIPAHCHAFRSFAAFAALRYAAFTARLPRSARTHINARRNILLRHRLSACLLYRYAAGFTATSPTFHYLRRFVLAAAAAFPCSWLLLTARHTCTFCIQNARAARSACPTCSSSRVMPVAAPPLRFMYVLLPLPHAHSTCYYLRHRASYYNCTLLPLTAVRTSSTDFLCGSHMVLAIAATTPRSYRGYAATRTSRLVPIRGSVRARARATCHLPRPTPTPHLPHHTAVRVLLRLVLHIRFYARYPAPRHLRTASPRTGSGYTTPTMPTAMVTVCTGSPP